MQTPAILNLNATQSPSPAAKPADNGGSDSSFNQMLSQQVDQRRAAEQTDNQQSSKTDDANQASNNTDATTKAAAAGNAKDTNDAADAGDAARKIAQAKKKASDDDKVISAADAVMPSVTDMIALANGNALKGDAKAVDSKTTDDKTAAVDPTARAIIDTAAKLKGDVTDKALDKATAKSDVADTDLKSAKDKVEPDFKAALADAKDTKDTKGAEDLKDAKDTSQPTERVDVKSDDKALNGQTQTNAAQHAPIEKAQDKASELIAAKVQDAPAVTAAMPQVQQAALHVAQVTAPTQSDVLAPQVGTTAWNQALGQKVVWMVHGEQQSASLTLNPPDLGPLQVVLSVNNGHADAAFYAHQPEVRQALEAALPTLRDMMGGAGIQLGQATVNAGTPGQGQAQQQMQQGSRNFAGNDKGNEVIAPLPRQTTVGGVGLVDTFA